MAVARRLLFTSVMKKLTKTARKLDISTETIRVITGADLRVRVAGGMFPHSNAYPTQCLVGTGCGNLSGTCC